EIAVEKLRETYRQRLSSARTSSQRADLAGQLLILTYDAPAGVSDAALLQLIDEDLARKARAVDVLFETAFVRARKYGTDELDEAEGIIKLFRRASLGNGRQDITVEHAVRLAIAAANAKNFKLVDELLQVTETLLRGSSGTVFGGQMSDDVEEASRLAEDLAKTTND
ncbi:MAG: hypothetical protein GY758_31050, partial [Fuerstiella sp.]|nr:hypothetical protein [Fuerstiella sp.]